MSNLDQAYQKSSVGFAMKWNRAHTGANALARVWANGHRHLCAHWYTWSQTTMLATKAAMLLHKNKTCMQELPLPPFVPYIFGILGSPGEVTQIGFSQLSPAEAVSCTACTRYKKRESVSQTAEQKKGGLLLYQNEILNFCQLPPCLCTLVTSKIA